MNAFVMVPCTQESEEGQGHGLKPPDTSVWQSIVAAVVGILLIVRGIRRRR